MKTEFKVGDRVSWMGVEGEVSSIGDLMWCDFGVGVAKFRQDFTLDGRLYNWHKEPSLVLIDRPKQKVKLYPALIKYDCGNMVSQYVFKTESEAEEFYRGQGIFIRLLTDDHHAVEIEE